MGVGFLWGFVGLDVGVRLGELGLGMCGSGGFFIKSGTYALIIVLYCSAELTNMVYHELQLLLSSMELVPLSLVLIANQVDPLQHLPNI